MIDSRTLALPRPPRSIFALLIGALLTLATPTAAGTFYLYGGPQSHEGRFETTDGVLDDQGWIGIQSTELEEFWQIHDFNAANLNDHGVGNHAMWAGRTAAQEPDWNDPPGYGDNWWAKLEWSQPVTDPSQPVTVGLEFFYNYEVELDYDHFLVEWLAGDEWRQLLLVTGTNRDGGVFPPPGEHFDQTWVVQPGEFSGPNEDEVRLRLALFSETGISDESSNPFLGGDTDGGAQVDDVVVTFDGVPVDGGGDSDATASFEAGDTEGWAPTGAPCRCSLWSALPAEHPGASTNPTPVLAQVGDASTGLVALSCRFWSPLIPWSVPEVVDGALLILDVFAHTGTPSIPSWYSLSVSSRVDGVAGPYEEVLLGTPHEGWQRIEVDLSGAVTADAESIRLQVQTLPQGPSNVMAFDDVTVVRFDSATAAGAGPSRSAAIERVFPNPANPSTRILFRTSTSGPVRLTVHDARGRRVRTLLDRSLGAGSHHADFDGQDQRGVPVASGVYWIQLVTPTATTASRLALVE